MNYHALGYWTFFTVMFIGAAWCMWQIAATDWRRRIIPDAFLFPLMIIGLIFVTFFRTYPIDITQSVIGAAFGYALAAIVGFAFDYTMRRRSPNADTPIGMGDIKLICVGGIWMGPTIMAWGLIIACITGAIWGRINHVRFIPFAPFFIAGGILSFIGHMLLI